MMAALAYVQGGNEESKYVLIRRPAEKGIDDAYQRPNLSAGSGA